MTPIKNLRFLPERRVEAPFAFEGECALDGAIPGG